MDAVDRRMIHILSGTDMGGMCFHQLYGIENFTLKIVIEKFNLKIVIEKFNLKIVIENNFFPFIFISWRLITLQYSSGFCHTLT